MKRKVTNLLRRGSTTGTQDGRCPIRTSRHVVPSLTSVWVCVTGLRTGRADANRARVRAGTRKRRNSATRCH
eukprot:5792838-Prymnesium_polylepis.1